MKEMDHSFGGAEWLLRAGRVSLGRNRGNGERDRKKMKGCFAFGFLVSILSP